MIESDRPTAGSTALVTGASSGIGFEIARQLLDAGLIVWVAARNSVKVTEAVDRLPGDARALVLDVTDPDSIDEAARRVTDLDVLVNNAGIGASPATIRDESASEFHRVYATNVFGPAAMIQAFLPALGRSAHPRVVNVSSIGGSLTVASDPAAALAFRPAGSGLAYRSSKAALNGVTVLAAQALHAHGIKVNAFAPGLRKTKLNDVAQNAGGDPAEGAAGAVRLALLPDDGPSGVFQNWDGASLSW